MKKILLLIIITNYAFSDGYIIYQKHCVSCHGKDGKKKFIGKNMNLSGKSEALAYKELDGYRQGILSKYGLGEIMKKQIRLHSEKEIKQLAKHMSRMK